MDFTHKEKELFRKLNTPAKVQDYLNSLKFNFEKGGETLRSPLFAMRAGEAHCFEGALLGAYILSLHGFKPLVMHLKASNRDYSHVVAPFKINGYWGALSKTNHAVLRYREPVYKNIRELAMSYFHEYFLNDGTKTMEAYSQPMNLNDFEEGWEKMEGDLWGIDEELDKVKHYLVSHGLQGKGRKISMGKFKLRKADKIEIMAGKILQHRH